MNAAADSHRKDLPDGTYAFGSKLKTSMKVDVAGASKSDSANVRLWGGNGTNAQKWKVTHDGNGYVTLISVNSGKVSRRLRCKHFANGANVQQYVLKQHVCPKVDRQSRTQTDRIRSSRRSQKTKFLMFRVLLPANGANVQLYSRKWYECPKVGEVVRRIRPIQIWPEDKDLFALRPYLEVCAISSAASWRIDWCQ